MVFQQGCVDLPDEFFLAVGSLDPRKNFRALVDAYAGLPDDVRHDAPLVVVGASAASFASTDSGHRAVDGVRFLGRVPDVVLASLYRRASVFVSPSLDEGFGIPVVEAIRRGTPVLFGGTQPAAEALVGVGAIDAGGDDEIGRAHV